MSGKKSSSARLRRVGIVGWRGMVGSVLLQRMAEEDDFNRASDVEYTLFSTTQAGRASPVASIGGRILDARDLDQLAGMDCLLTCQGSSYTGEIHPRLRAGQWQGCWIDAASSLRLAPSSTLVLDVVNRDLIIERWHQGCRDFIGANCTVSLMMMAIWRLLSEDLIEWIYATTYQSASGAGAAAIDELLQQMTSVASPADDVCGRDTLEHKVLQRARLINESLLGSHSQDSAFSAPLCANVIPWIDACVPGSGQSREEWKAAFECNAILNRSDASKVAIEGVCVRVPVLRCHSQSLLMRLRKEMDLEKIVQLIAQNPWTDVVENTPESTARDLHPLAVSGSLRIKAGRIRRPFSRGQPGRFVQLFTVGDQLLWGAAEPLRRMLGYWLDDF